MSGRGGRSSRSAFALNASMSVVLLGLIAAVALVVKPAAPPGIAEFAPQAAKPITKAPQNQSSTNGQGTGACAVGQTCAPSPSPKPRASIAPAVVDDIKSAPSALQCYTWPDGSVTQTFDPQSPPCVATYDTEKGNGGATSQGVSASTIRVAYPQASDGSMLDKAQLLVDFFNTRFQLYGRKLQLVPFKSQQASSPSGDAFASPTLQRADAAQAAALKPFASLDFLDTSNVRVASPVFIDTLARQHVVSISGGRNAAGNERTFSANAPYAWTYLQTPNDLMRAAGEAVCSQLVGKPAIHSGDYVAKKRSFAVIYPDAATTGPALEGVGDLKATLARCGLGDIPFASYNGESGTNATTAETQWKQQGITTVIYFPWVGLAKPAHPLGVAKNVRYNPEWFTIAADPWIVGGIGLVPNNQIQHMFGVMGVNKLTSDDTSFWRAAYAASGGDITKGFYTGRSIYQELLLLASGIQMAGPRLTPQSFAQGMQSTEFPNPGAGGAPSYQGRVGFGGDHAMLDDYVSFWVDAQGSSTAVTTGATTLNPYNALCWVRLGERNAINAFPKSDDYYKGRCR